MKQIVRTSIIISMSLFLCLHIGIAFAQTPEEIKMRAEFNQARSKIQELRRNKDLLGLKNSASRLSSEWKEKNVEYYGDLMRELCNEIRRIKVDQNIDYETIRSLAKEAIDTYDPENENNISIETHYKLLNHLQARATYPKGSMTDVEYARQRELEVKRWVVVWNRLEDAIDPKFNPEDVVSAKVALPIGVNGNVGMAPSGIKDQKLRAEYENAIEENNKKIKYLTEQHKLRSLKRLFVKTLAQYFAETEMVQSRPEKQFAKILSENFKDPEVRADILKAVEAKKSGE